MLNGFRLEFQSSELMPPCLKSRSPYAKYVIHYGGPPLLIFLQAMVKNLFEHFTVLYNAILPANPTLASEHALRQEAEVYKNSTKLTYKNVSHNYHSQNLIDLWSL